MTATTSRPASRTVAVTIRQLHTRFDLVEILWAKPCLFAGTQETGHWQKVTLDLEALALVLPGKLEAGRGLQELLPICGYVPS